MRRLCPDPTGLPRLPGKVNVAAGQRHYQRQRGCAPNAVGYIGRRCIRPYVLPCCPIESMLQSPREW